MFKAARSGEWYEMFPLAVQKDNIVSSFLNSDVSIYWL